MKRPLLWLGAALLGVLLFFISGRAVTADTPLFILNPAGPTKFVYTGTGEGEPVGHTVMGGELVRGRLPARGALSVQLRQGDKTTDIPPTERPKPGELAVLDLGGDAAYVLFDLSPQYNPRKPPPAEGFTPKVLALSPAGAWHRFTVGSASVWGPFEDPNWDRARADMMRGRPVLKLMRVGTSSATWDAARELAERIRVQLREKEPVRWLERGAPRR